PYYIATSSLVFTEPITLFFAVIALNYYFFKPESLLGGFFAGLAVLCRQYFIYLPIAFIIIESFRDRAGAFNFKKLLNFALPFIMYIPLIFLWKGLIPGGSPEYWNNVSFNLISLNYVLIIIGVYIFPFVSFSIVQLLENYKVKLPIAFCMTPIFLLGIPLFSLEETFLKPGPFKRIAEFFGNTGYFIYYVALFLGFYIILSLI
ncbi:hypothetical protein KY312_00430, partial [Candidatus Woesearchaeota archaeon]|nr:hypothetical protein [Candidatus Woesearchaeota archaeon]